MGKLKTALDSGNSYFTGQIDVINEKYIPAWENLRTRLAEIIGVEGGDSEDKEGRGKQKAGSTDGGSASGGKPGSIIDIMQTGGDQWMTLLLKWQMQAPESRFPLLLPSPPRQASRHRPYWARMRSR